MRDKRTLALLVIWLVALAVVVQALLPQARQFLDRARYYFDKGDLGNSRVQLDQAKKLAPADPELQAFEQVWQEKQSSAVQENLRVAKFYFDQHQVPEAEKAFRSVLQIAPDHPEARKYLDAIRETKVTVQKFSEQGIRASAGSGRSNDVNLLTAFDLYNRGQAAFARGELTTALGFLDQALLKEPNFKEARALRDKIFEQQKMSDILDGANAGLDSGKFLEAVTYFDRLLEKAPRRVDWRMKRGLALFNLGQCLKAIEDFQTVLLWRPSSGDAQSIKRLPPRAEVVKAMALAYRKNLQPLEAWAIAWDPITGRAILPWSFREAVYWEAFPWYGLVLFLGMAFLLWAAWIAWREFDSLVERIPFSTLTLVAKTLIACAMYDPETQVERLKLLIRRIRHPWLLYVHGLVLILLGDPEKAQESLQESLDSPAISPRAYFFLGLIRLRLGQPLADHNFEQALLGDLKSIPWSWRPWFLRDLEERVLAQWDTIKKKPDASGFHALAFQAFRRLDEGVTE